MNIYEAIKAAGPKLNIRNKETSKVMVWSEDPEQYRHIILSYNDFISEEWEPGGDVGSGYPIYGKGEEPCFMELFMAQELFDAAQTIFDICKQFLHKEDIEFVLKACPSELKKLRIKEGDDRK